ncbi:hypothetical protein BGZ49_007870, partial [Haplosporangium sp. Z 27]
MVVFEKFNLDKQSVEVPGTRSPGGTGHYRHAAYADSLVTSIRDEPHVKTLYDMWQNSVNKYADNDFLGHRPFNTVAQTYGGYSWETYRKINQRVNAFGSGIMHLNQVILGNEQLNRWALGIWSHGRPEWFISEMTCNCYNLISVALYDTLGPDAIEYIVNHADIQIIVSS